MGDAVGLHVAKHRNRKHAGWPENTERRLELAVQAVRRRRARLLADHRLAAFGVGDQYRLAQPGLDRRRGMTDVKHERAATNRRSVDPCRRDAEIMCDLLRSFDRGRDTVDIGQFQAGIGDGVQRRIRVQLDLRRVRNNPEFGRLGSADHGDLIFSHDA